MTTAIRPLTPADLDLYLPVRRRALAEHPDAFGTSVAEHDALPREEQARRLAGAGDSVVFGAFVDGALVGIGGIVPSTRTKRRHRADVYGMFVASEFQGRGLGRAILEACLAHARALGRIEVVALSVNAANAAARKVYVDAGFVPWGIERDAFRVDGAPQDEEFLTLRL